MSWMDSWSRPSKSQPTPPPLYLTVGPEVPYCHTCGRVIGDRKKHAAKEKVQEVKYCSARCRNNKPRPIDRRIEGVFVALLDGVKVGDLREREREREGEKEKGEQGNSRDDADTDAQIDSSVVGARAAKEKEKEVEKSGTASTGGNAKKKGKEKVVKGDPRIIVECAAVEEIVFPREKDPAKVFGRRKNRAARGVVEAGEWRSVDMVDEGETDAARGAGADAGADAASREEHVEHGDSTKGGDTLSLEGKAATEPAYGFGAGKIRPPQEQSDINGGIGGEKGRAERVHESEEMKAKRKDGERRAEEKEMVKRAARRGVAFGFGGGDGDGGEKRKCEAVMKGVVVESSFAKGEWGIRWREK